MNDYIIKTENLSFSYTESSDTTPHLPIETTALRGINLNVKRGEYVAVLGHNGSGKSTLAKLLNMILVASEGKIYIDGVDITAEDFGEDEIFDVRKKVGMVFQNPDNQLVATVVEEDVAFGPENLGLPREEIRRRVDSALSLVGMTEYVRHAPHKLSGGQKQRVAIAGIIAMKPEIIIFDESTAMLDPVGRHQVVDIMERLNREEGITVINITHYMEEAARADRVVVINDGALLYDGTPAEVFSMVRELRAIGLEVPQPRELLHELRLAGLDISSDSLSADGCAEEIIEFLKGNDKK